MVDNSENCAILENMKEWGSCMIEVFPWVMANILDRRYDENCTIIIENATLQEAVGGQPIYHCNIRSSKLEKGYHCHQDYVILAGDDYKLKKWVDV